ncbi:hypothetical protein D3C76_763850 [compost metagenome]
MPLTNAGRTFMASAVANAPGTKFFDNANAYIGIGSSTAAFADDQVDLQAPVEKFRKKMDPGYPIVEGKKMTFRCTLGPDDANFAFEEWGIFNDPVGGVMLHRSVQFNGTKQQGQTWVFQCVVNTAP